ncbi:hypothetical protein PV08_08303 [Exophiala spinifera]|uniref:Uncharacterized protein n=1 Tax=Exophiala spinifera TaxID=91928 RepID=A0A0D1YDM6_9EURO|nr:uncharacterized protein PV08_08303 [Exophiala spinifera]KIW13116.1 hypothetical protein PV08_08303 [Exophiala spinifera]
MAFPAVKAQAVTRAIAGTAIIIAPSHVATLLGIDLLPGTLLLARIYGARELVLGTILWPHRYPMKVRSAKNRLRTDASTPTVPDGFSAIEPSQPNIQSWSTLTALRSMILTDCLDILFCIYGYLGNQATAWTCLSVGAVGIAGIGLSVLGLREVAAYHMVKTGSAEETDSLVS